MRQALILILLGVFTTGNAANLIPNSSFELGTAGWTVIRSGETLLPRISPVPDSPVHGSRSIRFNNSEKAVIELFGGGNVLEQGKTYTLSFYAKASEQIPIRFSCVAHSKTWKWNVHAQTETAGQEWKRHTLTFSPEETSAYLVKLDWGNHRNSRNSATVWLDAFQLEEGKYATKYAPAAKQELFLEMESRVSVDNAPLNVRCQAANYTDFEVRIPIRIEMRNTFYPETVEKTINSSVRVLPGATGSVSFTVVPERYGEYKLRLAGNIRGQTFVSVRSPYTGTLDLRQDRCLGIDYGFHDAGGGFKTGISPLMEQRVHVEQNLDLFRLSGIRLLRVGNTGSVFNWKSLEPEKGKYCFQLADQILDQARTRGFKIMMILGNMFYLRDSQTGKRTTSRVPDHVIRNAEIYRTPEKKWDGLLPSRKDWRDFANQISRHFAGRITAYEITNEPNIVIPAEPYADYVKTASREIRRNDPAALVIGGSVTTDFGGKTDRFVSIMKEKGALETCDALSFHPYNSRLDTSRIPAEANINGLKKVSGNKILWNTELYYFWDAVGALSWNGAYMQKTERPDALIRRIAIDFGEGIMQSSLLGQGQLLTDDNFPLWEGSVLFYGNGNAPNSLFAACNSASYFFTKCHPEKTLRLSPDVTAYQFHHRNNWPFVILWNKKPKQKLSLIPPDPIIVTDLFGNPLHGTQLLTDRPLFLYPRNEKEKNWIRHIQLLPEK